MDELQKASARVRQALDAVDECWDATGDSDAVKRHLAEAYLLLERGGAKLARGLAVLRKELEKEK